MAVSLQTTCRRSWQYPLAGRELRSVLAAMLNALDIPGQDVDVSLADDAVMARCNQSYLGYPGPTNVLAFPAPPSFPASLILNLDALERECLLYDQDTVDHILRLLAHGMAHIAGHDHGPAMDEACAKAEAAARDCL